MYNYARREFIPKCECMRSVHRPKALKKMKMIIHFKDLLPWRPCVVCGAIRTLMRSRHSRFSAYYSNKLDGLDGLDGVPHANLSAKFALCAGGLIENHSYLYDGIFFCVCVHDYYSCCKLQTTNYYTWTFFPVR